MAERYAALDAIRIAHYELSHRHRVSLSFKFHDVGRKPDAGENRVQFFKPAEPFAKNCQRGKGLLISRSFAGQTSAYNPAMVGIHHSHYDLQQKSKLPVLFL
jgi:hypothetical protein